ncbi:MAG TPA: hypothetical protein DCO79_16490, partial [Spirochaeta sp.]|nr:hypothetical protein [Spirochaeta sp.]
KQAASLRLLLESDGILPAGTAGLFVSPMQRALETAGILFGTNSDTSLNSGYAVIDEFAEIDFGDWDGMSWKEINGQAEAVYKQWLDDPVNLAPPGGETLVEFNRRVDCGLNRVFQAVGDDPSGDCQAPVVIVAHGGVIRSIICILLGLEPGKHLSFRIDCASYSMLSTYNTLDGKRGAVLSSLNKK